MRKIFKVKCTGENPNYGKKDEIRELNDAFVMVALKNNWIENKVEYKGSNKSGGMPKLKKEMMPMIKINIERIFQQQDKKMDAIKKALEKMKETNEKMLRLL